MAKPKQRETLNDLLLTCGVGPNEAARKANISPTTLWSWRTGSDRVPQIAKIAAFAKALGIEATRVRDAIEASRDAAES